MLPKIIIQCFLTPSDIDCTVHEKAQSSNSDLDSLNCECMSYLKVTLILKQSLLLQKVGHYQDLL